MGENPPSNGGEPGSATAPAFRAGSGSSAGRALMLTVEMHSTASRFGCRISTREPQLSRSHARVRTGHARRFRWCWLGLGRPNDRILVL
ncbi:hypothetical protein DF038_35655 [Burkholderia cepacia]|nr:hypothetical protein DF038_35655 [Burkholderia cepacia]